MNTRRNGKAISTILIISALIVATASPALAEPQPPTPFYISGEVNYDTGEPVPNPTVTVENTNTGESFDVSISGNAYQVTTSSDNVSAGDILHFNASNDNVTEFDHTVTQDEMNAGGFVQNITIVHPAALMPDLIVTDINSYHNNTGCPAWFNVSNEIDVTVKNDGDAAADASNVCLYIEDVFFGKLPVSSLAAGASETVTFEDWKPVGDDCLQEPCVFEWSYEDYNFTAVADCDSEVTESNETNNETTVVDRACYNGYIADEPLENVAHGMLHGGLLFTTGDGTYAGLYSPGATKDTNYDITLPDGAAVELAQLNVYYTWTSPDHACPEMEVRITNATGTYVVPLEKAYNDIKCTCPGASWIKSWGNYVFDITDYVTGSGTYTVTVENVGSSGHSFCIAAPGIVLVYEDENAPLIEYWVNKGADVLMGGRRYATSSNLAWWECINNATFQASTETGEVVNATLGVVAPWGGSSWSPGMTNFLFFNDVKLGTGVYHGYGETYDETIDSITMHVGSTNAQVGANVSSVTAQYLKGSDNVVGQADDGDNMMPANAFLVVEYEAVEEKPDLVIEDIRPIRWCCCCIKEMQVAFVDDPELAKELGNEELRKEVAEALAEDPELADEVAAKLAGDDKKAAKELSRDPKQLALYCCRCSAIKELADLLDTELTAGAQHEMSDVLDEIVGCGGGCCGCCNSPATTTDCRCCCCGRLIAYKIANVGDARAGWSLSNLTVNGRVRSVDIVRPLDAGQSRWEVFPCYRMWWWPRPHEVTVCADVTDWVVESDETNNCRTEWFPPPNITPEPIRALK